MSDGRGTIQKMFTMHTGPASLSVRTANTIQTRLEALPRMCGVTGVREMFGAQQVKNNMAAFSER